MNILGQEQVNRQTLSFVAGINSDLLPDPIRRVLDNAVALGAQRALVVGRRCSALLVAGGEQEEIWFLFPKAEDNSGLD